MGAEAVAVVVGAFAAGIPGIVVAAVALAIFDKGENPDNNQHDRYYNGCYQNVHKAYQLSLCIGGVKGLITGPG